MKFKVLRSQKMRLLLVGSLQLGKKVKKKCLLKIIRTLSLRSFMYPSDNVLF